MDFSIDFIGYIFTGVFIIIFCKGISFLHKKFVFLNSLNRLRLHVFFIKKKKINLIGKYKNEIEKINRFKKIYENPADTSLYIGELILMSFLFLSSIFSISHLSASISDSEFIRGLIFNFDLNQNKIVLFFDFYSLLFSLFGVLYSIFLFMVFVRVSELFNLIRNDGKVEKRIEELQGKIKLIEEI